MKLAKGSENDAKKILGKKVSIKQKRENLANIFALSVKFRITLLREKISPNKQVSQFFSETDFRIFIQQRKWEAISPVRWKP